MFTKQNEKRKWEKKGKIDQDVTVAYHKFCWMFFCLTILLNKKITTFAYLESQFYLNLLTNFNLVNISVPKSSIQSLVLVIGV